jgi:hypothetical protein
MLGVGKETDVSPDQISIDNELIASPSFAPSFPYVRNDNVHVATLEFLLINLISFFKVVPQSL